MEGIDFVNAIGSVGFPIVACCAMFYMYNEIITKVVNTLDILNNSMEMLAEELRELRKDKEKEGE